MCQGLKVFRFRFSFKRYTTQTDTRVRTRFTEAKCEFAWVVKYKDKVVGFVNSKKRRYISRIQEKIGNGAKIEVVASRISDVDADNEYQAMINDGGDVILRLGTPVQNGCLKLQVRKRTDNTKITGPDTAKTAATGVKRMCIRLSDCNIGVVGFKKAILMRFQKETDVGIQQSDIPCVADSSTRYQGPGVRELNPYVALMQHYTTTSPSPYWR